MWQLAATLPENHLVTFRQCGGIGAESYQERRIRAFRLATEAKQSVVAVALAVCCRPSRAAWASVRVVLEAPIGGTRQAFEMR